MLTLIYLAYQPNKHDSNLFGHSLQAFSSYLNHQGLNKQLILLNQSHTAIEAKLAPYITQPYQIWNAQLDQLLTIVDRYENKRFVFFTITKKIWLADFSHFLQHPINDAELLLNFNQIQHNPDFQLDNNRHLLIKTNPTPLISADSTHHAYLFTKDLIRQYPKKKASIASFIDTLIKNQQITVWPSGGPLISTTKKISPFLIRKWTKKKPCLFLDRDGVINKDTVYPYRINDFHFFDDILPILEWAKEKNWYLIIVTNQSGIAKGYFNESDYLNATHHLNSYYKKHHIQFNAIFHDPSHENGVIRKYQKMSFSRKPNPGMVLKAMAHFPIDLTNSLMIGDKISDQLNWIKLKTLFIKGCYPLPKTKRVFSNHKDLFHFINQTIK